MIPHQLNVIDTIAIESVDHLAEVVAAASATNQALLPIGGGTCLATGCITETPYLALDLSELSGIDDYIPTDMTASFQAGTSLKQVRTALAANGQELPIDLAEDDAGTIGGLVATGFSGPRRLAQGTLKDLIIGCEYVRGDGLLAKAGGMTVKNVSGFEISRLLHGSWGSLAILTRVNLKLLPQPRGDRTITWTDENLSAAIARQQTLLQALPMAVAVQSVRTAMGIATSIRFMGREAAIADYLARATALVGDPSGDSADWVLPRANEAQPLIVCTAHLNELVTNATMLEQMAGIGEIRVSLGTGTLWATIDPAQLDMAMVSAAVTGLWTIEGGPATWKAGLNVWGPDRGDGKVAQSIKQQFDPVGVLNRGRLFV
ncbi:MAG: FAD-binding oxidoreductase [Thermomicrobiales bacterium]|nr:FAD-binding oxidoreductase [Thermomicrobiales bacterium]